MNRVPQCGRRPRIRVALLAGLPRNRNSRPYDVPRHARQLLGSADFAHVTAQKTTNQHIISTPI